MILHIRQQPKQKQVSDMLLATGKNIPVRIGLGGARGGTKSRTIRDGALIVASEVAPKLPGIVIYIIRQIWGDVYQNHVQKLDLERPELSKYYNAVTKEYSFPEAMGSPRIVFGFGDTVKDIRRIARGPEAYLMLIDQSEAFREEELDELHTPNRWPAAGPGGAKTVYSFNPGGPGSPWLKRVFYDRDFELDRENPEDYAFVQAYGFENWDAWFANEQVTLNGVPLDFDSFYKLPGGIPPCPSGNYNRQWLNDLPDNHQFKIFVTQTSEGKKMWSKPDSIRMGDLFGSFESFSGQYFPIWNRSRVVIS